MNNSLFWKIIDSSFENNNGNIDKQILEIEVTLSNYSINDILAFENHIYTIISQARESEIYAIAYHIFKEEISTNRFDFFMGWLILKGSSLYKNVLKDPVFLKEVIEINFNNDLNSLSCENAIHIASSAYNLKTGRNYFEDF